MVRGFLQPFFDIVKSRIAPSATVTKVTGVALSPSVDGCLERSAQNALRRDVSQRFCRLLDRTPSGRSEDKLVFLNQYSEIRNRGSGVGKSEQVVLMPDN